MPRGNHRRPRHRQLHVPARARRRSTDQLPGPPRAWPRPQRPRPSAGRTPPHSRPDPNSGLATSTARRNRAVPRRASSPRGFHRHHLRKGPPPRPTGSRAHRVVQAQRPQGSAPPSVMADPPSPITISVAPGVQCSADKLPAAIAVGGQSGRRRPSEAARPEAWAVSMTARIDPSGSRCSAQCARISWPSGAVTLSVRSS